MKVPNRDQAKSFLRNAEKSNPGPWVQHSLYVAEAAERIAAVHPDLCADLSYTLGCLHDIGRGAGVTEMRHIIDGYRMMQQQGFPGAARICITHSFPVKDVRVALGRWDCPETDRQFVVRYLEQIIYNQYDTLIQLCDALAMSSGFCLIEKRLMDVVMRRGMNAHTIKKWRMIFRLKEKFEAEIGRSVYAILPDVVENTFGFNPGCE
ncbi:HD domain-containing protein [candidate division KSB1 bacterium]|nr:HD domain-containing protein [candidate division KSB1 bacterium]